jgi:hypothetical protein
VIKKNAMSSIKQLEQSLYERDFVAWLEQQATLARASQVSRLDLVNIAEELEGMGRSERRALESQLIRLLMHLLKWQYQGSHRTGSWHLSIRDARRQIERILKDSPSLQSYTAEIFAHCYDAARGDATAETNMPVEVFPVRCPYTLKQVRDAEFLPNTTSSEP